MIISGIKKNMTAVWKEKKVIPVTEVLLESSVGEEDLNSLKEGVRISVKAAAKGRGFQGVVKRYNFAGAPKSHGTKHTHRAPGSIGATGPQRVMPGKKMPGRMGGNVSLIHI